MKIGDKVKIVKMDEDSLGNMKKYIGEGGKIVGVGRDSSKREGYRVKCSDGCDWFWLSSSLKVIEDAKSHEFKVGDKVRIKCLDEWSCGLMEQHVGMTGVVDRLAGDGNGCHVEGRGSYKYSSLELVEDVKPREFKVGDRVRVRCLDVHSSSCMRKLQGREGVVYNVTSPSPHDEVSHVHLTIKDGSNSESWYFDATSLEHAERTPETKAAALAAAYGAAPKFTHAATIVLASGREVRIPDPDPKAWERDVAATQCFGLIHEVSVRPDLSAFHVRATPFSMVHDEARCWAADMARIVNERETLSPFETRFSHVTEVRVFRRRPPAPPESYTCAYPALETLRK